MSRTRSSSRGAMLVAAAAALLGGAGLAASQVPVKPIPKDTTGKVTQAAKPKPTTHIKITKERTAAGEVAPVLIEARPCDTLVKTVVTFDAQRDDSIRLAQFKLDSIESALMRARLVSETRMRVAEAQERFRAEMTAKKEVDALALRRSLERGAYVGIAGGASAPQRALRNGYTGGYNVTVPLGYDATDLPWGIRADASVDHLNGTRIYSQSNETLAASGDLTVWSVNTDLKLRIPTPGGSSRTHFYALGGIGAHRVTGGVYGTTDPNAGSNLTFNKAATKFGWNVGAGAAIAWGPAEVFIESRFFQVKTDLPYHMAGGVGTYTAFTPVMIGVQWF